MKKSVFGIFGLLVMALCFWSCGNSNTPAKVVEKSIEYVQDKNYEAYVDSRLRRRAAKPWKSRNNSS